MHGGRRRKGRAYRKESAKAHGVTGGEELKDKEGAGENMQAKEEGEARPMPGRRDRGKRQGSGSQDATKAATNRTHEEEKAEQPTAGRREGETNSRQWQGKQRK